MWQLVWRTSSYYYRCYYAISKYQTQGIFYTKTLYNLTPYPNFLSIPILVVQARNCLEVASSTIRITEGNSLRYPKGYPV